MFLVVKDKGVGQAESHFPNLTTVDDRLFPNDKEGKQKPCKVL